MQAKYRIEGKANVTINLEIEIESDLNFKLPSASDIKSYTKKFLSIVHEETLTGKLISFENNPFHEMTYQISPSNFVA